MQVNDCDTDFTKYIQTIDKLEAKLRLVIDENKKLNDIINK
jgi:hypothetical protein